MSLRSGELPYESVEELILILFLLYLDAHCNGHRLLAH